MYMAGPRPAESRTVHFRLPCLHSVRYRMPCTHSKAASLPAYRPWARLLCLALGRTCDLKQ